MTNVKLLALLAVLGLILFFVAAFILVMFFLPVFIFLGLFVVLILLFFGIIYAVGWVTSMDKNHFIQMMIVIIALGIILGYLFHGGIGGFFAALGDVAIFLAVFIGLLIVIMFLLSLFGGATEVMVDAVAEKAREKNDKK